MAYRRTERVARRLAARRDAILAAARAAAAEGGMTAVQIAAVAARAGIAAGTVYRYFPSKTELVNDLIAEAGAKDAAAIRQAADSAPGPLSAIAAAAAAFGQRATASRKLTWALAGEPAEADAGAARAAYRSALAAEFERLIARAASAALLPDVQSPALSASALIGAMLEGLIGPVAPDAGSNVSRQHEAVQAMTLFVLRALGIPDARARGLVVQITQPPVTEGAA
jgi:AcrR family transcriptional regulator